MRRMRGLASWMVLALVCAALLVAAAGPAAAAEPGWKLRVSGVWVDPDFSLEQVDEQGDRSSAKADSDFGFALGFEYRFPGRLGLELGFASAASEVTVRTEAPPVFEASASDELGFESYTAALNIHLTPNAAVDFYIAPQLAFVRYDDLRFTGIAFCEPGTLCLLEFEVEDDLAWGLNLGIDVPLGERGWLLNGSLGYLDTAIEVTDDGGSESFGFDLITASVGVGYRF